MSEGPASSAARGWTWAFLLPLALFVALLWSAGPIDDDYICFRYGRNLVEGHGLVFNPGERVEGFSTPLWVFLAAGSEALGLAPEWTSRVLSVGALLVTLLLVARRHPRTAFLLACLPGLAFQAVAGLGTTLFALLLIATWASWECRDERGWRGSLPWLCLGLAVLTRGEALLWILPLTIARLIERRDPRVALAWLPWLVWQFGVRAFYFERSMPVTFAVKDLPFLADLEFGVRYLALGGWSTGYLLLAGALGWALLTRRLPRRSLPFAAGAVLHLGFVVQVGGDFVEFGRFWMPAVPLLAVLLASVERAPWRGRPALAALLVLPAWSLGAFEFGTVHAKAREETARWIQIGRALDQRLPARARIGTSPIGALGYYAKRPIVDLLGLTNDKVWQSPPDLSIPLKGHQRTNHAWALRERPEVFVLGNGRMFRGPDGQPTMVASAWELELLDDPNFGVLYTSVVMSMPVGEPLLLFVRSDAIELVRALGG